MRQKWKVYLLTMFTYAIIHSIRTAWSSIKPILNKTPFFFSSIYLGQLDMTVLLCLAFSLNMFGWIASKWNVKCFLLGGMALLALSELILSLLLFNGVSSHSSYVLVYGMVGLFSCTGWPSCFYIISKYFSKKDGIILSIWNSSSQLGDFLALAVSFLIVDDDQQHNTLAGKVIITIAIILVAIGFIDFFFLHPKTTQTVQPPPPQNQQKQDKLVEEVVQPKQNQPKVNKSSSLKNGGENTESQGSQKQAVNEASANTGNNNSNQNVTFFNVWCLPSVTPLVIVFSLIKAVNSIVVNWLVFYLALVGLVKQSRVISITWSFSIVLGGIFGAYVNKKLDKKYFIGALFICSILFVGLQQLHVNPNTFSVLLLILLCGFLFGGPYNLMGTAVPLMLGEREQIKKKKNAIAAIISVMEGGAQLVGALFMIIIPSIGVIDMHWVPAILCFVSALILTIEEAKKISKEHKKQMELQIKNTKQIEEIKK